MDVVKSNQTYIVAMEMLGIAFDKQIDPSKNEIVYRVTMEQYHDFKNGREFFDHIAKNIESIEKSTKGEG